MIGRNILKSSLFFNWSTTYIFVEAEEEKDAFLKGEPSLEKFQVVELNIYDQVFTRILEKVCHYEN